MSERATSESNGKSKRASNKLKGKSESCACAIRYKGRERENDWCLLSRARSFNV